ncbi:hypothetical protein V2J09_019694 [Rumex salicifolius]
MDHDFDEDVEDLDEENQPKKQLNREVVENKQRAKRSVAWKHFTPFIGENNEERARCNYCNRVFGAANGTTNMIKHSKTCEENPENNQGTQSKIAFETSDKGRG